APVSTGAFALATCSTRRAKLCRKPRTPLSLSTLATPGEFNRTLTRLRATGHPSTLWIATSIPRATPLYGLRQSPGSPTTSYVTPRTTNRSCGVIWVPGGRYTVNPVITRLRLTSAGSSDVRGATPQPATSTPGPGHSYTGLPYRSTPV